MLTVTLITSFWAKSLGLTTSSSPHPVMFYTRFGIHTCFMRFPIDVLILDSQNKIVNLKTNLSPWRFYFWPPVYNCVIELPPGTISDQNIQIGTVIKVKVL